MFQGDFTGGKNVIYLIQLFLLILFFVVAIFGFAQEVEAKGTGYGEPLDLHDATAAADPTCIRVNGVYYLYPTTDSASVQCWSSTDRKSWKYEGKVWEAGAPGSWNDQLIWAPDVLPYDGKFYLYYAANQFVGVAVSDSPTGPFIDVYDHPFIGNGYGGLSGQVIDANAFRDDDGSLYMYCAWHKLSILSVIAASPMADPETVTGQWAEAVVPKLDWEFFWAEGPWMLKEDGIYYLMYSGNGANWPFYAIGYATATDPMGPFTKYSGNPILKTDWSSDFWGPGHNSVVKDESGKMWIFYHTKTKPTIDWDRRVRINELAVDAEKNLYVVLGDDDTSDDDAADDDSVDDDSGKGGNEDEGCGC